MIRVRQVLVDTKKNDILKKCSSKLRIRPEEIIDIKIIKQSLDARKKPQIFYVYELDVKLKDEKTYLEKNKSNDIFLSTPKTYSFKKSGTKELKNRPVIIGSGPAGLMCAYMLALDNYKPIIIERGKMVEDRVKDVEEFFKTGILKPNSNVQFGEGGAGTFSDGKLNTQVKDKEYRQNLMLEIFVKNGANEDILYASKPHIGTDVLRNVVKNIRNEIIKMGGEFRYDSCLNDLVINDNRISKIKINDEYIDTDVLVLAIGHSARDTFKMLYDKKINMSAKPFAVGIRIQHKQSMIDQSQYGTNDSGLEPASYKLTYKASNSRGVYTFCMCPGGYVVNASSEEGMLAINGMSNQIRESDNANSAVIVTISPKDYGENPLDGIKFQRELEEKAYKLSNGKIPVQLFSDYKNNTISNSFKNIKPIFKGEYNFCDINKIFPDYINESIKEGINHFGSKIKGYNSDDAIIAAVESRTSSPIRIERDEMFESNIKGIYPIGEGAGYAGGITSSAIDGIKVYEILASIYK